jgi:hypothetical protein
MVGFKVIIKANAQGVNKVKLEQFIKNAVESNCDSIKIEHIKAKGTSVMGIVDPVNALEKTIDRRNASLWKTESLLNESEKKVSDLEAQVSDLLRIIREKEESTISDGFCNCNDWRSVGSDPETGDKLKRCNICERVDVR